ncbi:hypothetical protein IC582_004777 [Cucumis melo]
MWESQLQDWIKLQFMMEVASGKHRLMKWSSSCETQNLGRSTRKSIFLVSIVCMYVWKF